MTAGFLGLHWHAWATIAVVLSMVVLLVRDSVAPAMAVFGANVALLVMGVIDVPAAFAGFSNPAPMTVAALFVIARAVDKTGALQPLINAALGGGGSSRNTLGRLLVPAAGASAFLNNTPIVAMLTPQVTEWAAGHGVSPSRFLMPISFATILGGTVTVIGTSTNLVVSGLLEQSGYAPIGMFEISRIGLPVALVGLTFLVLFSHLLLPERRSARRQFQEEFREFVVQMVVVPYGPLDGATVEEGSLRHLQGVFLAEVRRRDEIIAPARPDTVLLGGDQLTFVGRVDVVRDLQAMRGLIGAERPHTSGLDDERHTFFEVVVSGASSIAGKTLREADFRNRFQAAVVAIHRAGERVNRKLGAVTLREGDTLLLLSDSGFANRWRDGNEFLLVSHLGGSPPVSTRKAIVVGLITAAIVGVAGAGILPMVHTALIGALLIVAFRVLTPAEARGALDIDVLVVIAASFGIGAAIQSSGLAAALADLLVGGLEIWGPLALLTATIIATVLLTELITNNAAAVLIYPVAIAIALDSGLDPRPFAIAITVAASASFLTPIGYQTNTMVYSLGGYRFTDYARLGLPLTVAVVTAIILFVPMFWPFGR